MRGQLSAEMMILIVVVLAIVAIAATQLLGSAQEAAGQISNQTGELTAKTNAAMKGGHGDFCVEPKDCLSGECIESRCVGED